VEIHFLFEKLISVIVWCTIRKNIFAVCFPGAVNNIAITGFLGILISESNIKMWKLNNY